MDGAETAEAGEPVCQGAVENPWHNVHVKVWRGLRQLRLTSPRDKERSKTPCTALAWDRVRIPNPLLTAHTYTT